jgi:twitching motility two-component system response regulator PilH
VTAFPAVPDEQRGPAETSDRDLRADLRAAARMLGELSRLIAGLDQAVEQQGTIAARAGRLEQECAALRELEASVRRERDQMAGALSEARAAYEALRAQRDARSNAIAARKVMVVDDAASDIDVMTGILRSAGYHVLGYQDGEGLEARVAAEQPDVLLLDIVMPGRNGYELLRALKRDDRTKGTPIVIVTSRNRDSDRMWSQRQGADEYVTKPFTPEQLLMAIERVAPRCLTPHP